jgi:hypothetical protein
LTSSATGRPVAPFEPPDFHAVPAMSRWAQQKKQEEIKYNSRQEIKKQQNKKK